MPNPEPVPNRARERTARVSNATRRRPTVTDRPSDGSRRTDGADATAGGRVPAALDGERLDRAVAIMAGCSRAQAGRWVDEGRVLVDGRVATTRSQRLVEGMDLDVDADPVPPPEPLRANATVDLVVVHEDPDVVVVDKPAGLVVHPGAGGETATLAHGLLARYPEMATVGDPERPGVVHRLDVGTSGLLMAARTVEAYESLVAQLSERRVERRYDALVWGWLDSPRGRVDAPVGRSRRQRTRMAVVADGRPAVTDYEVVAAWRQPAEVSRLSCRLLTGRTHQIRVHLASIGHPVVGDDTYGGSRASLPLDRPWLHAAELGFVHPRTGETLRFTSPLPSELTAVLEACAQPRGSA
ncbi:MAG: RluA family pseudouridine synthase [Acidimicrobiia bacterium]|nr:RluA family pseudouridine synthase [Acidimicrobiia bacterium]